MSIVLLIAAAACAVAALVWTRSARLRYGLIGTIEDQMKAAASSQDSFLALQLARIGYRKELHNIAIYAALAVGFAVWAASNPSGNMVTLALLVLLPAAIAISWFRRAGHEVAMARERLTIERRAEEALEQENLAENPEFADILASLRQRTDALRDAYGGPYKPHSEPPAMLP